MCEPRNRDNGASDLWTLTAYWESNYRTEKTLDLPFKIDIRKFSWICTTWGWAASRYKVFNMDHILQFCFLSFILSFKMFMNLHINLLQHLSSFHKHVSSILNRRMRWKIILKCDSFDVLEHQIPRLNWSSMHKKALIFIIGCFPQPMPLNQGQVHCRLLKHDRCV